MTSRTGWIFLILAVCAHCVGAKSSTVRIDFSEGFGPLEVLDSGEWLIVEESGNAMARLNKAGEQRPPVRRPTAYCLLGGQVWENMQITLRTKTLEPESTVNRDICIIFGYVDDTHFYYAHISSNSDDRVHNVIMKVAGTEREVIDLEVLPEARLSNGWHTVRVEHDKSGAIRVYVDDLEFPLMTARDSDYPAGSVGFGSFDDRALFDDVVVTGQLLDPFEEQARLLDTGDDYSLSFYANAGFYYQLQQSSDLAAWSATGLPARGQNAPLLMPLDPVHTFARVISSFPMLP
jgi:hypothetical protein